MKSFLRRLLPLFIVLALVILILVLWQVPKRQVASWKVSDPKDRAELENDARATLAQILGGAFLLFGLYFTWRTIQVSQEGQITERFTRAIDQLGSERSNGTPNLEVRIGGIYALERIAKDSEQDHRPIMEILSAYVRENAPGSSRERLKKSAIPKEFMPPAGAPDDILVELAQRPKPKTDIQAILTVLGRCKSLFKSGEDKNINLIRTNLGGANLRAAKLRRTSLWDCNLEHADLNEADLELSNLFGTNLKRLR